jgi:hypothetical protein
MLGDSLFKWLWLGSGILGCILIFSRPDKLVFEQSFWGTVLTTSSFALVPVFIIGGPIALVVALLLPPKKLCPYCYKAVRKAETVCTHCAKSLPSSDSESEFVTLIAKPDFSPEVLGAIREGSKRINFPSMFIMLGIWIGGLIISLFSPENFVLVMGISFPLGFISGWLWWSYSVPRWRKWAIQQPGVDADELQTAVEAAMQVWPQGHFFEKTEFKIKE